jgi:hypothetical protein
MRKQCLCEKKGLTARDVWFEAMHPDREVCCFPGPLGRHGRRLPHVASRQCLMGAKTFYASHHAATVIDCVIQNFK